MSASMEAPVIAKLSSNARDVEQNYTLEIDEDRGVIRFGKGKTLYPQTIHEVRPGISTQPLLRFVSNKPNAKAEPKRAFAIVFTDDNEEGQEQTLNLFATDEVHRLTLSVTGHTLKFLLAGGS
jgi:hypothetical protein